MASNLVFLWQLHAGNDIVVLSIVISLENLSGGMGTAAFVAYISRLCNKEFTATQYALLSSLAAVGRTILSTSSGITVDVVGWQWFFIISTAIALPGIIVLIILDRVIRHSHRSKIN
jgi:PAT family beta-lactamase induction signal transducer AmpG